MTKNEFIEHLEAPHYVNEEDIIGLQEVLKDFPYCQSAQMLLTKAFHVSENLNFESQLKKTAAFVGNRKQLHSLLFNTVLPELIEDPINGESSSKLDERSGVLNEIESLVDEHPKDDLLEKQIMVSAINSSIQAEVSDTITDDLLLKINPDIAEEQVEIIQEVSSTSKSFKDDEAHSFSDWLDFYKDDKDETPINENQANLWEKTSQETKVAIKSFNVEQRVSEKAEFYSATKMAKLSVQEDDDLVSETLANIYADQQNFEKAIKAFEKLQLKYPEKRVYFAGRIKEIQNNINL